MSSKNANAFSPDHTQPTGLDLDLRRQMLDITWGDGTTSQFPSVMLRKHCPCATCRTERDKQGRTLLPILTAAPDGPVLVTGGHLVGNYAIQLEWSDGHSTGIFDFRYLHELAKHLEP